jgi:predicted dehydrogenase
MMMAGKPILWLVGAGGMAVAYARVLQSLGEPFLIIGRGTASAEAFTAQTGIEVLTGGLDQALATFEAPARAIVCTGVEHLAAVTGQLVAAGTKCILTEKPGGLDAWQLEQLLQSADSAGAAVMVAYNRRFFASVKKAREIIAEDGGLLSCHFEFTEWSHRIANLVKGPGVKQNWLTANSSHVADLAFHLAGPPEDWQCWSGGHLDWHPAAARFCGAGRTENGVYFSYFADWEAPGRWGVEFMTKHHRLIFRPMEELHVTPTGSVAVNKIEIDNSADLEFKPGLYEQTRRFLASDWYNFCTLAQQLRMCRVYEKMAGYDR